MPRALPEALLEGFAWDAQGRRYANLAELHDYAARVAQRRQFVADAMAAVHARVTAGGLIRGACCAG